MGPAPPRCWPPSSENVHRRGVPEQPTPLPSPFVGGAKNERDFLSRRGSGAAASRGVVDTAGPSAAAGESTVIRLQAAPTLALEEDAFLKDVGRTWKRLPTGAPLVVFIDANVFETSMAFQKGLLALADQGLPIVCATTLIPGQEPPGKWPDLSAEDVLKTRLYSRMVHFACDADALDWGARVDARRQQAAEAPGASPRSGRKPG